MQPFKQTFLILHARQYSMEEEVNGAKTGKKIEGVTIKYLPTDSLTPTEDKIAQGRGQVVRGINTVKATLPISALEDLKEFPALYDCTCEMAVVADKIQVKVIEIGYRSSVFVTPNNENSASSAA